MEKGIWFSDIALNENPGFTELDLFVDRTIEFLDFVLDPAKNGFDDFGFLWEGEPELHTLAWETFRYDITESAVSLKKAEKSPDQLAVHGLTGRPMHFKLRALNSIAKQFDSVREQFSVRDWFKKVIEAIDAILDSLIEAAGGAGGMIKEFKDILSALA
jgi:hypothetical protein